MHPDHDPAASPSSLSSGIHLDEELILEKVAFQIAKLGQKAGAIVPPVVAFVARHLSASKGIPSFYLGLYFWILMLVGEAQILSQMDMLILAYGSLFVLPYAYSESRWVLDSLAALLWEGAFALSKEEYRRELYCAAAIGGGLVYALNVGIVLRLTVGVLCFALTMIARMVYFEP